MSERIVALYDVHPVDAEQILDDLRARGRTADALTPEDLFPLDQDHYGGAEAYMGEPMVPPCTPSSLCLHDRSLGLSGEQVALRPRTEMRFGNRTRIVEIPR
jgi:hypothetical protein